MVEPVCRTYRALRNPNFLARTSFCQRALAEWASCFHEHSRVNGFDRRCMRRISPAQPIQRMLPLVPMPRTEPALRCPERSRYYPRSRHRTSPLVRWFGRATPCVLVPYVQLCQFARPLASTVSSNTAYRRSRLRPTRGYPTGCSLSTGSTGYFAFQASKPPSRADARKPNLFSRRAARALVASSGQVQ